MGTRAEWRAAARAEWLGGFAARVSGAREAAGKSRDAVESLMADGGAAVRGGWLADVEAGSVEPTVPEALALSRALGADLDGLLGALG